MATKTIGAHKLFKLYTRVWESSKISDINPEGSWEVLLIYDYSASGTIARTSDINNNNNNNDGGQREWSREHTYAKSLGNTNIGTSGPDADAHHLPPSNVPYNGQ